MVIDQEHPNVEGTSSNFKHRLLTTAKLLPKAQQTHLKNIDRDKVVVLLLKIATKSAEISSPHRLTLNKTTNLLEMHEELREIIRSSNLNFLVILECKTLYVQTLNNQHLLLNNNDLQLARQVQLLNIQQVQLELLEI